MVSLLWSGLLRLGVPALAIWTIVVSERGTSGEEGNREESREIGGFSWVDTSISPPGVTAKEPEARTEVVASKPLPVEIPPPRTTSVPVEKVTKSAVLPVLPSQPGSVRHLLANCEKLSRRDLNYVFGSNDPDRGGLDCSGTIYWLLRQEGVVGVPRQSNHQWDWLEKEGALRTKDSFASEETALNAMQPGDLLFWRNTYDTGVEDRISHVMIYLGEDPKTEKRFMFGARSSDLTGRNGAHVDVFEFRWPENGNEKFAGFGSVPGLRRSVGEDAALLAVFSDL